MPTILFVRSWADVRPALQQVNRFLALRRPPAGAGEDDRLLAIWVSKQFDRTVNEVPGVDSRAGGEAELWIQESFSLDGIWTLCRIDGPLVRSSRSCSECRDAILQTVITASAYPAAAGELASVFPVFDENASAESVEAELSVLKLRYPRMIGSVAFLRNQKRGVYSDQTGIAAGEFS